MRTLASSLAAQRCGFLWNQKWNISNFIPTFKSPNVIFLDNIYTSYIIIRWQDLVNIATRFLLLIFMWSTLHFKKSQIGEWNYEGLFCKCLSLKIQMQRSERARQDQWNKLALWWHHLCKGIETIVSANAKAALLDLWLLSIPCWISSGVCFRNHVQVTWLSKSGFVCMDARAMWRLFCSLHDLLYVDLS